MFAKIMTTHQISETLDDIYGFEASERFISDRKQYRQYPPKPYIRDVLSIKCAINIMKYVADKDRKPFTEDLKTIYHSLTEKKHGVFQLLKLQRNGPCR